MQLLIQLSHKKQISISLTRGQSQYEEMGFLPLDLDIPDSTSVAIRRDVFSTFRSRYARLDVTCIREMYFPPLDLDIPDSMRHSQYEEMYYPPLNLDFAYNISLTAQPAEMQL